MPKHSTQNYLVAFIDLLGQREQMKGLLFIPPKSEILAREDFSARMTELMKAVAFIQNTISQHTESANTHHLDGIEGADEGTQAKAQEYRKTELHFQYFSDGIVLFSPLASKEHYPLRTVLSIFSACASTMLLSLGAGYPLRIGIAIGAGCTLHGNDIYGPVVAEAFRLESKVANYPRIALHNELLKWLISFADKEHVSEQARRVATAMAKECTAMVIFDEDGIPILDFLNPTTLNILGGVEANKSPITSMREFVSAMISKFSVEKNEKLLEKYIWLNRYIDSRLPKQSPN